MPPQYNNNLINGYQHHVNNNNPFAKNAMLSNNPMFYGSIRDANFQNRVNVAKLEQRKRVKTINELNLTQEQLLNYVIDPIKVVKQSKEELDGAFGDRASTYIDPKDLMYLTKKDQTRLPKWMKELYAGRKNTPYKSILKNANILKKEDYDRNFDDESELCVHKVTQLDKDEIRFIKELEEKLSLFETHDGELKMIYSLSKKTQHKKDFEYIQKYKHRNGYNPEDYNDLKKYYKKEQKRINKENKKIDQMIEELLMTDQLSKEDLAQLQTHIEDDIDTTEINTVFQKGEKELEKELEKQLRKELGDEQFDEIMGQLQPQKSDSDNDNDNEVDKIKRVRIKEKVVEKIVEKKPKVKVRVKDVTPKEDEIEVEEPQIGQVDESDLEKYKNRKIGKK